MSSTSSKNKYLAKNTIIFAIGNFASKFITFLLVPLYTCVLSPTEFGTVDLLYTICNFLVPLFTFNIVESVLRFSLDKDSNQQKIISNATISIIFLILSSLCVIPITSLFSNYRNYSILFYFYLVTLGISQIYLISLKGKEKLKLYSFGNILYTFSIAVLNIIFLLVFKLGIKGYFLAYIISNIIIAIYSFIVGKLYFDLKRFCFDYTLFKSMIKYSLVLIPTSFMWWIMNFMDRVMVTNMISLSANGIYAVSYKIPTILSVLSSIFTQAWLFSAVKNKDDKDDEAYTNNIFSFLSFITILAASFLILIINPLFRIYVAKEYFTGWIYVPILLIGYIFLTLSTFISTSYNVNKDSKGLFYSGFLGACINMILNFLLIPNFGVIGAAIATSLSYFSVFIFRLFNTRKYLYIKISKEFIYSIFVVFIITLLCYINSIISYVVNAFLIILILIINKKKFFDVIGMISKILKKYLKI